MRISGWCLDGYSRPIDQGRWRPITYCSMRSHFSTRCAILRLRVQILKPKPALCSGTFEAQLLGMDEVPDRAIIDLEATLGELRNQPLDREVLLRTRCTSHSRCSPENRVRLVATHRAQRCPSRAAAAPTGRRREFLCGSNTKGSIIVDKTRLPSIVEILLVSGIGGRW
jgi:hypothetical protein